MASRVVPASSVTMLRSVPSNAFRKEDLPTLGRPRIAMRGVSPSGSSGPGVGNSLTNSSSRSPVRSEERRVGKECEYKWSADQSSVNNWVVYQRAVWIIRYRFFFSSRRRHTRFSRDWSSDVCSSDLASFRAEQRVQERRLAYVGTPQDSDAGSIPIRIFRTRCREFFDQFIKQITR